MTSIEKIAAPAASSAAVLGQGTAIEQSRAVAQVQAAVLIARQFPRNEPGAIRAMRESCARPALANRAFYEYQRSGKPVIGSTIKLAQELARIWGNIDFGLSELRLDVEAGQSEILAHAWDMESNARFSQIVIVQHRRDKTVDGKKVAERLSDQRDIYEINTSNGARRLRECIRRVVPDWFFEEAEARCRATLENPGDGVTLAQRIAHMVRAFENGFGVDVRRLEARIGKGCNDWNGWDVSQLTITGDSLKRGDITVEDAFPQSRVTAAEVISQTTTASPSPAPVTKLPDQAVVQLHEDQHSEQPDLTCELCRAEISDSEGGA